MAEKNMMQLILQTKPSDDDILLPNDIIIEILSCLPAKSLLRFRWTCKYWFDLITNYNSDSFIKMHLHRSSSTTTNNILSGLSLSFCFMNSFGYHSFDKLYLGYYYLNCYNDTNQDVPSDSSEVYHIGRQHIDGILGSSNGLLVLLLTKGLCILNLCTKEYRVNLPHPLSLDRDRDVMGDTCGFGYDQTIDDYKVIRIKYYYSDNDHHHHHLLCSDVQVYTLGKNSWRRIIGSNIPPYRLRSGPGVFLNGALYWIDCLDTNIVCFDIGKEKFHHVSEIPNLLRHLVTLTKLQVFEGSLCLLIKSNWSVEIWVMKDYTMNNNNNGSSLWTKLLTIPRFDYFPITLLRYWRNSEILMLNGRKDLVLYDTKNTTYQTLSKIRKDDYIHFSKLYVYTESLISVNSGTYMDQQ